MRVKDKINMNVDGLIKNGPITIVAFGDSVTHGALGLGEFDYDTVYWNVLRKKILELRDYVPVNVINSGIGGTNAVSSLDRMDKQVFSHNPDLVIISFGLNDVYGELDVYLNSLKIMFERCAEKGVDVIFMTPNMFNTYVADDTAPEHMEIAKKTAEIQNGGKMDMYMQGAVKLANSMNVIVCDCYSKWKKISETEDITMLLANRVNHPTREMHKLFADSLFEVIFDSVHIDENVDSNAMYVGDK